MWTQTLRYQRTRGMLKDIHSGRKRNETLRIISLILKVKSIRDGDLIKFALRICLKKKDKQ